MYRDKDQQDNKGLLQNALRGYGAKKPIAGKICLKTCKKSVGELSYRRAGVHNTNNN